MYVIIITRPLTALLISYRRSLILCTALSTAPPGHPGLPATTCMFYVAGLLPIGRNLFSFSTFFLGPPKINDSNAKDITALIA